MSLPPLATLEELTDYLGEDVNTSSAQLTRVLLMASAFVRSYTRQDITAVPGDQVTLDGTGATELYLPQLPVTDVALVTIAGTDLLPQEYQWSRDGTIKRISGWFGWWPSDLWYGDPAWFTGFGYSFRSVQVTYSHGYDDVPDDLREVVCVLAARMASNPAGVVSESLGGYRVAYPRTGSQLFDEERAVLDQYRIKRA